MTTIVSIFFISMVIGSVRTPIFLCPLYDEKFDLVLKLSHLLQPVHVIESYDFLAWDPSKCRISKSPSLFQFLTMLQTVDDKIIFPSFQLSQHI